MFMHLARLLVCWRLMPPMLNIHETMEQKHSKKKNIIYEYFIRHYNL